MRTLILSALALTTVVYVAGCTSTEPQSENKREALREDSQTNLKVLERTDPSLAGVVDSSYAYIIFPDVAKGALVVGAAGGRGIVYEQGQMAGYAKLNQLSAGVSIGADTFSELVVFKTQDAFNKFKANHLSFGAGVNAVALKDGRAAATHFTNGVAVFVHDKGGLMADASLSGQNISFAQTNDNGQ